MIKNYFFSNRGKQRRYFSALEMKLYQTVWLFCCCTSDCFTLSLGQACKWTTLKIEMVDFEICYLIIPELNPAKSSLLFWKRERKEREKKRQLYGVRLPTAIIMKILSNCCKFTCTQVHKMWQPGWCWLQSSLVIGFFCRTEKKERFLVSFPLQLCQALCASGFRYFFDSQGMAGRTVHIPFWTNVLHCGRSLWLPGQFPTKQYFLVCVKWSSGQLACWQAYFCFGCSWLMCLCF